MIFVILALNFTILINLIICRMELYDCCKFRDSQMEFYDFHYFYDSHMEFYDFVILTGNCRFHDFRNSRMEFQDLHDCRDARVEL